MGVLNQLKHAWNVFLDREPTQNFRGRETFASYGASYGGRPDRLRLHVGQERTIVASIYTRIAIDFAQITIRHVTLDSEGRYTADIDSGLHNCLTLDPNIDQSARALKQDIALRMFDRGVIAIVPVDTTDSPVNNNSYDINSMRVGEIVQWFPRHVQIALYNDQTGLRELVTLPKRNVAIVENPFYPVMNELNSTLRRLMRKLTLLDYVDEASSSGKLDMIIQLPYTVRSEQKRSQSKQRLTDIENQLKGSQHGIAYIDGTEKVIQLNRPVENNLLKQVQDLKTELYNELGITAAVMDGTADEAAMLNYISRTLEPLLDAVCEEMKRKFLTKNARTRGQSIEYFRDPFKLIPMSQLADIIDKLIRNEAFSANEVRQGIGVKPSTDPKANELRNPNMPPPLDPALDAAPPTPSAPVDSANPLDDYDPYEEASKVLDDALSELGAA
jgi:hypothetical protein